ncbi:MAG: xanthine dehydrogenase family protein molybdopterin-binding subunit [Myxococcaceae bacterium]|nr:xanthine dehydrogenase family protein molybdopterin-binding subunit [Myxococcaceae bacterium]
MTALSRRDALKGLGLALGGLVVPLRLARAGEAAAAAALAPNPFIHIAPDGLVTLVCARSEMGQGVRSSLHVLLADELGADHTTVRLVQGDGDEKYGDQNTDGSTSVRGHWKALRDAAAQARMMLTAAAAKQLGVPVAELDAHGGAVHHEKSGRSAPFAQLVADAAAQAVPKEPVHRPRSELKNVGTELPLVDGPAIVDGSAVYGADVKIAGMLSAVVLHPPVVGAKLDKLDATKALAVPGVKYVFELPSPGLGPKGFKPLGGVAVVATNTWAAMRGRAQLVVDWLAGDRAGWNSQEYDASLSRTVNEKGSSIRETGDTYAALETATKRISAEYHVPHLAHATMEPPAATAHFDGAKGTCEIWASTQNPQAAIKQVADTLGISTSKVTVHVTLLGGGFGRKSKPDYVAEAAFISRLAGAPVRLQWSREDDIRHDYYHSCATQRLEAGLDANGKIVAWLHRTVFPTIASMYVPIIKSGVAQEHQQGVLDWPLSIPNVRAEKGPAYDYVRIGWLRSVHNVNHAFAINSFIDELAHARGVDPKDNLLEVIGPARIVTTQELGIGDLPNYGASLTDHPVDTARLRDVVERVTKASGWAERKSDSKRGYGLAVHRSFLTYVAVVAAVAKDEATGKVRVDEAWICADAGTVVNLERVRSQLEGAVIFGQSIALFSQITGKNGSVVQSNFRDYRLTRIGEAPRAIHVEVVQSERAPGGVGEPGVPPVAPAIANAVFALTGKRVRELPMMKSGLV